MKYLVIFCAALAAGCILPISTGAPMPPTTVGKGRIGMAISGEAPTLDLIADNGDENMTGSPSAVTYGAAPAAASTLTFSYGLGENTDIEVAGEGALYFFIFPLPTGGSIGLRQHIGGGDAIDLGVAARIGRVSSSAEITTSSGTEKSSASATYGAFQLMAQTKRGFVRPMAAVSVMPARISRDPSDAGPFNFSGLASSVTAGLMLVGSTVQVGPYLTATNFYSDLYKNSGWFVSGGLMIAFRPDRNREPAPPPPMNAPPAPGYGPPPGDFGPPPMGPPMGPPAPMPADPNAPPPPPAPTAAPM